jgi:hypothetical protein
MSPDRIAELALIEMSRVQREVLARWVKVCADAGETETAADLLELFDPEESTANDR